MIYSMSTVCVRDEKGEDSEAPIIARQLVIAPPLHSIS